MEEEVLVLMITHPEGESYAGGQQKENFPTPQLVRVSYSACLADPGSAHYRISPHCS